MWNSFGIKLQLTTVILATFCAGRGATQALVSANDYVAATKEIADESESTTEGSDSHNSGSRDANNWKVAIYPVLAWAPVFGASVSVPNAPSLPGPGGGTSITGSGTTSGSFNGAALAGVSFQEEKWLVDFTVLWAGLSADKTQPRVHISTNAVLGDLFVGRQIYHHIALTGGLRRMGLRIGAQLGDRPEVDWKPGVWDPLVGLDWREALSHKWSVQLKLAGGGFGVGNDVDISASFRADWRFTRRFGLTMGYGALHFQNSTTVLNEVLKTKQTLNGPIFGFGIYL